MADDSFLSLARLQTEVLEATWLLLRQLPHKNRVLEEHIVDDQTRESLELVLGQPAWLVSSLLEAVLAERGSFTAPAAPAPSTTAAPVRLEYRIERHYGTASPELVWSGETGARSCARATRYVIEDLFASVRHSVLIARYGLPWARRVDACGSRPTPPAP